MRKGSKFIVTVEDVQGECRPGYKVGDVFEFTDLRTPQGEFCGGAYHSLFPKLFALHFGGKFHLQEENTAYAVCPDKGKVTFKIKRIERDLE